MFSRFRRGDKTDVNRWAVLWDAVGEDPRAAGLAVEHEGHVDVFMPPSYGVPRTFRGEYRVLQPDGSLMTYRPGHDGYFEQVLVDLGRVFPVGKTGAAALRDRHDIARLYLNEVVPHQRPSRPHDYPVRPRAHAPIRGGDAPYAPRRRRNYGPHRARSLLNAA